MLTITPRDQEINLDERIKFLVRFLQNNMSSFFYLLYCGMEKGKNMLIAKENSKTFWSRRDLNSDRQIQSLKC